MLGVTLDEAKGIATLVPDGKLHASDFTYAAAVVDPYLQSHGGLNGVLVLATHFPGWEDIAGFTAHLHFVKDRQDKIKRVAFVSDSALLKLFAEIASLLVRPQVRLFPTGAGDEALAWLKG